MKLKDLNKKQIIQLKQIERIVDFVENNSVDTTNIFVDLELINCDELEKQAMKIDKENYSKDCFQIEYNYIHSTNELYPIGDGIFYINIYGEKNYLDIDKIHLGNIERSIRFELNKFLKDKNKYLQENTNVCYEKI